MHSTFYHFSFSAVLLFIIDMQKRVFIYDNQQYIRALHSEQSNNKS